MSYAVYDCRLICVMCLGAMELLDVWLPIWNYSKLGDGEGEYEFP